MCYNALNCAVSMNNLLNQSFNPAIVAENFEPLNIRVGIEAGSNKIMLIGGDVDIIGFNMNIAAKVQSMEALSGLDISTIVISEASMYDVGRDISIEEYLSEGVIGMFVLKDGTRAIQISKMRGIQVDNKPRPYNIIDKVGIEVYPTETIFSEN